MLSLARFPHSDQWASSPFGSNYIMGYISNISYIFDATNLPIYGTQSLVSVNKVRSGVIFSCNPIQLVLVLLTIINNGDLRYSDPAAMFIYYWWIIAVVVTARKRNAALNALKPHFVSLSLPLHRQHLKLRIAHCPATMSDLYLQQQKFEWKSFFLYLQSPNSSSLCIFLWTFTLRMFFPLCNVQQWLECAA